MFYLTTIDQVKLIIGDDNIGTTYDTELDLRILAVTKRASSFCKRDFEQASRTELYHGGESRIYVDNPPIKSIESIVWDDFGDFEAGFVIPEVDYFIVNRDWDIAHTSGPFPGGDNGLQAIYTGGYKSASETIEATDTVSQIPPDLSLAIAQQVAWEFKRRKDTGLTDVSFPDGSIIKAPERMFLPLVADVLKSYRVAKIG